MIVRGGVGGVLEEKVLLLAMIYEGRVRQERDMEEGGVRLIKLHPMDTYSYFCSSLFINL